MKALGHVTLQFLKLLRQTINQSCLQESELLRLLWLVKVWHRIPNKLLVQKNGEVQAYCMMLLPGHGFQNILSIKEKRLNMKSTKDKVYHLSSWSAQNLPSTFLHHIDSYIILIPTSY